MHAQMTFGDSADDMASYNYAQMLPHQNATAVLGSDPAFIVRGPLPL